MALSTTFAQSRLRPRPASRSSSATPRSASSLVYNNAIARLRRTSRSFEEASADLGADTWQTFRLVTLPGHADGAAGRARCSPSRSRSTRSSSRSSRRAGVKTLPIWIFQSFRLANQVPLVNVAGRVAILLSVIPVYIATRMTAGDAWPARAADVRRRGGHHAPASGQPAATASASCDGNDGERPAVSGGRDGVAQDEHGTPPRRAGAAGRRSVDPD